MNVEQQLKNRIEATFAPHHLEVINESHMHSVPVNSETHFKVVLVSDKFEGLRQLKRHQEVYHLAEDLLEGELHALALHTYTSQEWKTVIDGPPASPNCRGGGANGHSGSGG